MISKNKIIYLCHLPTFLLVVGYPIFWIELYVIDQKNGVTSPLAIFVFFLVAIFLLLNCFKNHVCPNQIKHVDEDNRLKHEFCHPRESGGPALNFRLDSRFRGNDMVLIWTAMCANNI